MGKGRSKSTSTAMSQVKSELKKLKNMSDGEVHEQYNFAMLLRGMYKPGETVPQHIQLWIQGVISEESERVTKRVLSK